MQPTKPAGDLTDEELEAEINSLDALQWFTAFAIDHDRYDALTSEYRKRKMGPVIPFPEDLDGLAD